MTTTNLNCRNCGSSLPIPGDAEFIRCQYCSTPHMVQRSGDGSPSLTMLEAAVERVGQDVRAVDAKTADLLRMNEQMGARLELTQLQSEYRDRVQQLNEQRARLDAYFQQKSQPLIKKRDSGKSSSQSLGCLAIILGVGGFMAAGAAEVGAGAIVGGVILAGILLLLALASRASSAAPLKRLQRECREKADRIKQELAYAEATMKKRQRELQQVINTSRDG